MARITIVTRGGDGFGLGHLHRVSWMLDALAGAGCTGLELRVECLDSAAARVFAWPVGVAVGFSADPIAAAVAGQPNVAVVDWLDSAPAQLATLAATGCRLAVLDDYGPALEQSHLAINALLSPLANAEVQRGRTRILSGAAYVQFPREVTQLRGESGASAKAMEAQLTSPLARRMLGVAPEPARSVLLSFGGAAIPSAIELTLRALSQLRYSGKVLVLPAPAAGERPGLPAADSPGALDIDWLPPGPELHPLLAAADLAVLAGGLTLYEAAFLGIPALALALNAHQQATALKLETAGTCRYGGLLDGLAPAELAVKLRTLIQSPDLRGRMSAKGLALFDGRGLQRTIEAILGLLE